MANFSLSMSQFQLVKNLRTRREGSSDLVLNRDIGSLLRQVSRLSLLVPLPTFPIGDLSGAIQPLSRAQMQVN